MTYDMERTFQDESNGKKSQSHLSVNFDYHNNFLKLLYILEWQGQENPAIKCFHFILLPLLSIEKSTVNRKKDKYTNRII